MKNVVTVYYQHRTDGTELVDHEKVVTSHEALCDIIDRYPWAEEVVLTEKWGEGGGLFFLLGDIKRRYASFQLVPTDIDSGLLSVDIVQKPGFLGTFGRKSVTAQFDVVSITDAKVTLQQLFDFSIEGLYEKYQS
ncbi:hypothetical protein ACFFLZ_14055 [Photobacterium aphoticum]|uniref:Uncharacterized protein n=1 Tax=Photobacterium aphoticum TaxID=754436 RepID=A0A090QKR4_9GAMM|nr:hypothetical protein [Photobacterium aphoticum]KLV00440.1 hypothetical protein ABT58_12315 [Photobacterium aphoticum]PSU59786.1 hypothetical protein C9I90_02140 [Photobacterium aphoticum]GAL03476.1 hypothetical protein JCM19237_6370 [Photobacterium aphoticum]GHA42354.1 hypothetical protein GCM10007086_14930 [Photobacterium aphoticum]